METLFLGNELAADLISLIASAEKSISIFCYQFTPLASTTSARHRPLLEAVMAAPKRGLQCRILLATMRGTHAYTIANKQAATQLLQSGWQVRMGAQVPLQHAKSWLFDGTSSLIGSHNLTEAAMQKNIEASIYTDSPTICARLANEFNRVWEKSTPAN